MRTFYNLIFLFLLGLPCYLTAQQVSGTILDDARQPLPGASIKIKGTNTGTTTDLNGKFSLKVEEGSVTLEVSFVGFEKEVKTLRIGKGENAVLNLTMRAASNTINELVVVGYGVQRKRDITSSVVKIEGKELTEIPTPSFENGLQGKASGVQVITGSGAAGSASVVRIRGVASVSAGGDPLYVVDGIPITQDYFLNGNRGGMNTNPLATINPNDIESIEVLKDAAATGIYGSRGSNGVILITTKRGKKKGMHVDFSNRFGFSRPTALPNMLNSQQYLQIFEEAWVNDGRVGTPVLPGGISWEQAQRTNTDWVSESIRTGFKRAHDLGISNATEKYNVYFGLSNQGDESYLRGNAYDRNAVRLNGDFNFTKKLKASFSSSLSQGVNRRQALAWSGGLGAAMSTALPIYPIFYEEDVVDENGIVIHRAGDFWLGAGIGNNPRAMQELRDWRARENRTINNLGLEFNPIKNLVIRGNAALDFMDFQEDIYEKPGFDPSYAFGRANQNRFDVQNYSFNGTANYLMDLKEKHYFNFLLGTEYQNSTTRLKGTRNRDVADGPINKDPDGPFSNNPVHTLQEWNFISWFGRVNYNYKGKYFAEALGRVDGSSKFGRNNKYGFFPSASAGWIVSEENFAKKWNKVSFLKLKSSIGINGNSNIPFDAQFGIVQLANNTYNNETIIFPNASNPSNPNLRWETSRTIDGAIEYGFFKDRISGELAFYNRLSRNVLLNTTTQFNTGFSNYWDNVGTIQNQGVEFTVRARIIDKKFKWNMEFNIARNSNVVKGLGDYTPEAVSGGTNDTRLLVNHPVGTNFLVRFSHIDAQSGRPVYLDINGNPTFIWDPANRVPVGNVLPDAIGGWKNEFRYGQFDLTMFWVFVLGGDIYDSSSKRQLGVVTDWNMRTDIFDRWQRPGDNAKYPILTTQTTTYGSGTPWINTNMWLHDGTYARLRNLSLGYNFDDKFLKKTKLQRARVSVFATNVFTLTRFIGLDPEIARDFENPTDRNMSPNITYLTPPQERTFNISIDISF